MSVRAKFRVSEINKAAGSELANIALWPVTSGSAENAVFFNATPCGKIELGTVNAKAVEQFEVGKEYYVDFTRAE